MPEWAEGGGLHETVCVCVFFLGTPSCFCICLLMG